MLNLAILTSLLVASGALAHPTPPRYNETTPEEIESQINFTDGVCTVEPLGGARDDGPALLRAFETCARDSVINLPGPLYTVDKVLDTELHNVVINLEGVMQYTPNIEYWSPASIYLTYQNATTAWKLSGQNITLQSQTRNGGIDGSGQTWWDAFAIEKASGGRGVAGGSSRSFARPIPLAIVDAYDVRVDGLSITNAPFWHMFTYQVEKVEFSNMFVKSISNSNNTAANTDGWDTYRSNNVIIRDSVIINGDDCVSFKPNSSNILVENLYCDGSHGISVGSLGQYAGTTDIVENVYARNITLINTEHGARIKVFPGHNNTQSVEGGGTGRVTNITWEDIYMENVDKPIFVTSCYNYDANPQWCEDHPSELIISDIKFLNMSGYASGNYPNNTVGSLRCSGDCERFVAQDIDIGLYANRTEGQYVCTNLVDPDLDFPCVEVPYGGETQLTQLPGRK